jgi:hypothetical protein
MAVQRALVYRAGTVGLVCAAHEVAIEAGAEGREGSMRPVRQCTELASVMLNGTRFCATCAEQIAASELSVLRVQHPTTN